MDLFYSQCMDYLEGRMGAHSFEKLLEENSGLREWLQSIVPSDKLMHIYDKEKKEVVVLPYKIDTVIRGCEQPDWGGPKGSVNYRYAVHTEIYKLIKEAFPDVQLCRFTGYEENFDLCLDACPSYIGGEEVAQASIIDSILNEIPATLSKTKRKKALREKIKEVFHVEGNKYPRWIQEPEWPVYEGKPMKYIRTEKANSEVYIHYFVDIETGFERGVLDAH